MDEARLRIVDKYLHRGWCSYLDIALAINDSIVSYKGDSLEQFGLMKFEPGKGHTTPLAHSTSSW